MKIKILLGAIRKGRKSEKIANIILDRIQFKSDIEAELIDLIDYDFPLLVERIEEMETVLPGFVDFSNKLEEADGIIIVAPEYKNGMPGSLKNALDYLKPQIFLHKPIGITTVSNGGFGGVNCLAQLRLTVLALGGLPIPEKLSVSNVSEFMGYNAQHTVNDFTLKTDQFINGFIWYVERLKEKEVALI